MKKIAIFLIVSAMATSILFCGCSSDKKTTDTTSEISSEVVTGNSSATENITSANTDVKTTERATEVQTEKATPEQKEVPTEEATEEKLIDIDENAHENYQFVDETVTNPTVVIKENNSMVDSSKTENLAGDWKVLEVVTVADSKILSTKEAFGSAYSDDSYLLKIADDKSFSLNTGNESQNGTYTISGNNLIVTYSNGEPDTFLYIPKFENKETIKVQVRDLYIYFAR